MRTEYLWISLGLLFFPGISMAEAVETLEPKCQNLANEYAENPDTLNEMQLKELQFCITKTLEQRYKTDPPEQLKGTIIDSPPASIEDPGTTPQTPSPDSGAQ